MILLGFSLNGHAFANNIGVIGTVYPIAEMDLRQWIQSKLINMQKSGQLEKVQETFNQNIAHQLDRPKAVEGLRRTFQPKTRLFDPSIIFPTDIYNSKGNLVVAAGTKINPLDTLSLSETLLFYNADDSDQVSWAEKMDQMLNGNDKLILVNGSVTNQMKLFHKSVYFDQGGRLTQRFGLQQVPAIISQQGNRLEIQEVSP